MPPQFSLQNVLDIRHSKVEALEIDLGKLQSALVQLQNRLILLEKVREDLLTDLTLALQGDMDLFKIEHLRINILQLDQAIVQVNNDILVMQSKVDKKRQELVTARQAEETLEILKRKGIERFNSEQALKETRLQDDIYIALAFRQRQQEA